jgi:modulator of FtsH protease HflC
MSSNRLLPVYGVIAAVVLIIAYSSFFIVTAGKQALVLRFGEIVAVKQTPGIYFKLPFGFLGADDVQLVDSKVLRFDLDNIRVQVSDGKFYQVDAFVAYKITDARQFRQAVSGSVQLAEQRLRTRLDAALRRVYGLRGFEAALSKERGAMMRDVRDQLRPDANSLGITIEDVRIQSTDLTKEVSQQTYNRMKSERLAAAEAIRARGRENAAKIRATADRQVIEIRAEAQKESEILRGEGDAEKSRIFAKAYSQDPQFFAFYRSMLAYKKALAGSNTTMVLSPDSEFFSFFGKDGGAQMPQSGSKAPAPQQ